MWCRRSKRLRCYLSLGWSLVVVVSAGAAETITDPAWYIFVDATKKGLAQHASYPLSKANAEALFSGATSGSDNQCNLNLRLFQSNTTALGALQGLASKSNTRFISRPGDVAAVYVFYDSGAGLPSVEFTEEDRNTQLVSDLKQLIAGLLKNTGAGAGPEVFTDCWRLTKVRAVLSVAVQFVKDRPVADDIVAGGASRSVSAGTGTINSEGPTPEGDAERAVPSPPQPRASPPDPKVGTGNNERQAEKPPKEQATIASPGVASHPSDEKGTSSTTQLITGPPEHWYLSFDLPLNSVNQAKIVGNTVEPRDEPTQVYIGLNWRIGDLFTTYHGKAFMKNIAIKGIVLATKRPLDSWGVELALRGDFWKAFGIDLTAFAPFVGYTFTKEDTVKAGGALVAKGGRNSKLRGGLSFNIDKGLAWLKGGSSKSAKTDK